MIGKVFGFMVQQVLDEALAYAASFVGEGSVATYIPELSKANPADLGVCMAAVGGECFHAGEWRRPFTIQSISKTIALILALQTSGYDKVFSRVGLEPTGDSFNSIVKLETRDAKPLNPMINAGAIATTGCILSNDPFALILKQTRRLCGSDDIKLNEAVFLSEKRAGMRNRSMAYWMKSENIIDGDVEELLDVYFRMCSMSVTTENLAHYAMILANDGVDPKNGERLIDSWIVRIVKTFMLTCGMYDGSGEFAIRVGMPSKSGVGGGILSTAEKSMGIAVYGPALDSRGNSVGGMRLLEYLSRKLSLHYFAGCGREELVPRSC